MKETYIVPGVVRAKAAMFGPNGAIPKGTAFRDDHTYVDRHPEAFEKFTIVVHIEPEPKPEPKPEPEPEPIDDSARPKGNASVAEWAAYVGSFGEDLNAEFLNGLKRDDLIAMADDFEAAAAGEESSGGDPDAGDD